ncbi:hypothetical protein BDR22DRAFT_885492 [Usnea florida]
MKGQPVASDLAVSMDLHHEDEDFDEDCAITVPFSRFTPPCQCPEKIRMKEPVGCKNDCAPVPAISDLKLQAFKQAIRQTKVRWAWFSEARALDEQFSRRLGTLGYLPFEVRDKIFRLVLDEYIEEAARYRKYSDPLGQQSHSSGMTWLAVNQQRRGEFGIWAQGNHPAHEFEDPKLYQVFCLRQNHYGNPPDFVMPLRLATDDTKFEFDRVFLSTLTFDFHCPKALQLFLSELSVVQLSQVRSITVRIYGCTVCSGRYAERIYYQWGFVCAKLPSTLISINFDPSGKGRGAYPVTCGFSLGPEDVEDHRIAKNGLQFLRSKVERIALETEVKLIKTLDPFDFIYRRYLGTCSPTVLDSLDAMVRETENLIARPWTSANPGRLGGPSPVPSFTSLSAYIRHGY